MARGIDHVVHAVQNLDAAATLYRALGFHVGSRNRHPPAWGTQNHIVQFPGCFVELLTVADPAHITPHGPHFFSFGAFNRELLSRGEGLSMLVLESRNAHADAESFRQGGIGDFEVFEMEREGKRSDGSAIKLAFSLAFAADPLAPDAGFFVCHHRYPDNFWNPAFQFHFNTATGIAGIVLVAAKPSDHYKFITSFAGANEVVATKTGLTVKTPRGEIQVMEPTSFVDLFDGEPPDITSGAQLAALRFTVRDANAAGEVLRRSGIDASARTGRLIVGPQAGLGATLVFES
jgi:hypothetical protein